MSKEKEYLESGGDPIPSQSLEHPDGIASPVPETSSSMTGEAASIAVGLEPPVDSDEPTPNMVEPSHPVGDQPDVDIPDETKEWVDGQITKWKTGNAILGRAKNNKRKDLAAIERYVMQLVTESKIPMSGRKTSASSNKNAVQQLLPSLKPAAAEKPPLIVEVNLSEIHMNAQIRKDNLNEANVLRIMESFDSAEPVDLFKRPEGELELANGYHRVDAAKRLGRTAIRAYIHEGTMCDALMFAYRTNDRNGIPLTKADRMNALIMIKKTPEGNKLTGDQLADQLGVSRQTIQAYLAEIRDGKTSEMKKGKPTDNAALHKKAISTLTRIAKQYGLTVFRAFVDTLDDGKRAELRTMLDSDVGS